MKKAVLLAALTLAACQSAFLRGLPQRKQPVIGDCTDIAATTLTASVSSAGVMLEWPLPDLSDQVNIDRLAGGSDEWEALALVPASDRRLLDATVLRDAIYIYRISASLGGCTSPPYQIAALTTLAHAIIPSVSETAPASITLSWNDASESDDVQTLERSEHGAGVFTTVAQVVSIGTGTRTATDAGLTPDTIYDYRVVVHNVSGDAVGLAIATATRPNDPDALDLALTATGRVSGTCAGSAALSHLVVRQPATLIAALAPGETAFTDPAAQRASMHTYRCFALGHSGNESVGKLATIRTPNPPAPNGAATGLDAACLLTVAGTTTIDTFPESVIESALVSATDTTQPSTGIVVESKDDTGFSLRLSNLNPTIAPRLIDFAWSVVDAFGIAGTQSGTITVGSGDAYGGDGALLARGLMREGAQALSPTKNVCRGCSGARGQLSLKPSVTGISDLACALLPHGTATCWGTDTVSYPFGDGTSAERTLIDPNAKVCGDEGIDHGSPSCIVPQSGVVAVSVGYASCALLADGRVKCWGSNADGSRGNGVWTAPRKPGEVCLAGNSETTGLCSTTTLDHVIGVSSGGGHACAWRDETIALADQVVCWGDNGDGQGGRSSPSSLLNAVPVNAAPLPDRAVQVAAGNDHTCALLANGNVYCWGRNMEGQCGVASTSEQAPIAVRGPSGPSPLANIRQIAAAGDRSCAIDDAGAVYCWGESFSGTGGVSRATPVKCDGPAAPPYCIFVPGPVIPAFGTVELRGMVALSLGTTSGCTIDPTGSAWCFDGTDAAPTELTDVIAVAAGRGVLCALTKTGGMRCRGSNSEGVFSRGDSTGTSTNAEACTVATPIASPCPAPFLGFEHRTCRDYHYP